MKQSSRWGIRTLAEAYRRALTLGLANTAEIGAWLDRVLAETDKPAIEVIEASLAASRGAPALVSALATIRGEYNAQLMTRGFFHLSRRAVVRSPEQALRVAEALYAMALDREFPAEDAMARMLSFQDALELADQQVFGKREDLTRDLIAFLDEYAAWPNEQGE